MTIYNGDDSDNVFDGTSGNDQLYGRGGNDILNGQFGDDLMAGGTGDDTYYFADAGDSVIELKDQGNDIVFSTTISWAIGAQYVERLTLIGGANINATGNGLDNILTGNSGNNVLNGNVGADTMRGGEGDDTYYVDNAGDVVAELNNQGSDTVYASISYALGTQYIENLILFGTASINATGNGLKNTLAGNAGNNVLDGKVGADWMAGGAGNDSYYVDNAGDVVAETADRGTDTVFAAVSYTLSANVEALTLTGNAVSATGNALDNVLTGTAGNNRLDGSYGADVMAGGTGDDTYYVDNLGDTVTERNNQGHDTVYASVSFAADNQYIEDITLTDGAIAATGNGLSNTLTGTNGNNILNGKAGADIMMGGQGNDTYYLDNTGDVINESTSATGGVDTVMSGLDSYVLAKGLENLTLVEKDGVIQANGNPWNNVITGNSLGNVIDGHGGTDTLIGGLGDDTYYIDNYGDRIVELSGEGNDTVYVGAPANSTAYDFSRIDVETIILSGAAASVRANALDNTIIGNDYNNLIDGAAGADAMTGGTGNDTYIVDNAGDSVVELAGEGVDTVMTALSYTLGDNVDNLILLTSGSIDGTGNALGNQLNGTDGNNRLMGMAGADLLYGYNGNDVLDGGAGADVMAGLLGDDTYYVDDAGDGISDRIDFGNDTVFASVSFTASYFQAIETINLTGSADINATGFTSGETINGNDGANVLDGLEGKDMIAGGAGNDIIWGGEDDDILAGGSGADAFKFTFTHANAGEQNPPDRWINFGHDIINDYSAADGDTLTISNSAAALTYTITQDGANAVITFDGPWLVDLGTMPNVAGITLLNVDSASQAFLDSLIIT